MEGTEGPAIRRAERRRLAREAGEEHVEIPDGSERVTEPAELPTERLRPPPVEQGTGHPEERSEPARRHAHVVEVLGIGPDPGSRVVGDEGGELPGEHRPELLAGGGGGIDGQGG